MQAPFDTLSSKLFDRHSVPPRQPTTEHPLARNEPAPPLVRDAPAHPLVRNAPVVETDVQILEPLPLDLLVDAPTVRSLHRVSSPGELSPGFLRQLQLEKEEAVEKEKLEKSFRIRLTAGSIPEALDHIDDDFFDVGGHDTQIGDSPKSRADTAPSTMEPKEGPGLRLARGIGLGRWLPNKQGEEHLPTRSGDEVFTSRSEEALPSKAEDEVARTQSSIGRLWRVRASSDADQRVPGASPRPNDEEMDAGAKSPRGLSRWLRARASEEAPAEDEECAGSPRDGAGNKGLARWLRSRPSPEDAPAPPSTPRITESGLREEDDDAFVEGEGVLDAGLAPDCGGAGSAPSRPGTFGRQAAQAVTTLGTTVGQTIVNPMRDSCMDKFEEGLKTGWGCRELTAMQQQPPPLPGARVMAVRHGMGHHNDMGGALSMFNRDSSLNEVGQRQAEQVGVALMRAGIIHALDLVVVSPFTRALETAVGIMGEHEVPTIVQPLCAEHTLFRSAVQQGDRGSTPEELSRQFPVERFPQFDQFRTVEAYCVDRGLEGGKWWLHTAGDRFESAVSFAQRANDFREWLGQECEKRQVRRVLVVSHGGLLTQTFNCLAFGNLECRVFDMWPDGSFTRAVNLEEVDEQVTIEYVEKLEGVSWYSVRIGLPGAALIRRRYSEFLELKNKLKRVGKEEHGRIFPGKLEGGRQGKLQAWLQAVVSTHGASHWLVNDFLYAPDAAAGDTGGGAELDHQEEGLDIHKEALSD